MPGAWSFYISVRLSARLRHLIWWGRRFRLPGPWHARLPQKIASFSSAGRLRVPDLAPLEDAAAESGFRGAPHRWSCLRGSRPRHGPVRCRSAVAPEPLHRESGGCSYSDRTGRETLLRSLCVGGDAEPCSSAHPSPGSHCGTDALAEGIDLAERQPNPGADRAAVLAGRVFRSLPARFEADRANRRIYRGQPGFSRLGALGGMLAVVQRGLAGETACPTKPPRRSSQNVETPDAGMNTGMAGEMPAGRSPAQRAPRRAHLRPPFPATRYGPVFSMARELIQHSGRFVGGGLILAPTARSGAGAPAEACATVQDYLAALGAKYPVRIRSFTSLRVVSILRA